MADKRSSEGSPDASDEADIRSSEPARLSGSSLQEPAEKDQRNMDLNVSDKDQAPNAASVAAMAIIAPGQSNSEKKSVWFAPSVEAIGENEAPIPVSQTDHASKDAKNNKGLEVLDTAAAPEPFVADFNDDSAIKEKEKVLQNEQPASREIAVGDNVNASEAATLSTVPRSALEESISLPEIDEEMQISPTRLTSHQIETTVTTAATTLSEETIFDAFSQRASTMRYTEGDDIVIPEATLVEEPIKEDIPSAEVVVPERYSVTVAGKKLHAGFLAIVIILVAVLTISLSVSLTQKSSSKMPTQSPTIPPTSSPTSGFYSALFQRVYGDDIEYKDLNEDRRIAMSWLEQDQSNTPNTLTDEELRERYALALLYFISNAEGSWYDDISFLSDDHICTWRMKRSGEKKGVLLCDDDGRVVQLELYSNSLRGTLPMELKYLTEIEVLRLDSNRIESSIPSALGSLSKLSELVLYRNALTGYLPKSFSNLVNLTTLHLSDNIFSGPLLDVDSISNLRTFRVDGNNFSGTIPKAFGGVYLDIFHINRNRFKGTMDFMCNQLPLDYKMDCDGTEPEVTCTCCVGCTIIGDDTCEKDEEIASVTISSGKYDDAFSWQLFEEIDDGFVFSNNLLAAGGEYDANEVISFQLCLGYPGNYSFYTQSNSSVDSGASIEATISGSDLFLGPQDFVSFELVEDGSLEERQYDGTTDDVEYIGYSSGYYYDDDFAVESIASKQGPCINFEMQLQTDSFGDEVSWEIVNAVDGAVVRSVDGGYYEGNTTYFEYECLEPNGCYTFTIYDQWQDGICCEAGNGWFNLSVNDRFLYLGGDYNASDSVVIGGNCATEVKSDDCPANTNSINVTVQSGADADCWGSSWEVFDNITGQIYCLDTDDMNHSLHSTYQCIPDDKCLVFVMNCFNETAGDSYEVTYNDRVVASNIGDDVSYQGQTHFGTCDK